MGCTDSSVEETREPRLANQAKKPKKEARKQTRMATKYTSKDVHLLNDENSDTSNIVKYTCPLCTNTYNKILACDDCMNCVCHYCFATYEKKTQRSFKCYFCGSRTSMFRDYELAPHSYFDATGKKFLSHDERDKIDKELKLENKNSNSDRTNESSSS